MSGLKCTVPGCGVTIRALTGLQELQKLRQHMYKAHLVCWTMEETMHNRIVMEQHSAR